MHDRRRLVLRSALASLLTLVAGGAAAGRDEERARVREAALATYIHGMTAEVAQRDFGPGAVPFLLELLRDPAFPRRDNLVAVLGQLGGAESTAALLSFLDNPPADLREAVEDRSLLLAPQALGLIAARGERRALEALLGMTAPDSNGGPLSRAATRGERPLALRDDLVDMALRGLAYSAAPEARGRIDAVAQARSTPVRGGRGHAASARAALKLFDGLHGAPPAAAPVQSTAPVVDGNLALAAPDEPRGPKRATAGFDGAHFNVNDSRLDYRNHVNVTTPMTDAQLDASLADAAVRMGKSDFDGDVACCAGVRREGSGQVWGSANDGLDIIDDGAELTAVLDAGQTRFKVVRAINHCGGPGVNIIGCAWIGGHGVAVVRYGGVGTEGALWAHEYGHNVGLQHNTIGSGYIMASVLTNANKGLTQAECDKYHTPNASAQADLVDAGSCTDLDLDDVQDLVDNCPGVANNDQTDSDWDGEGDACEAGCGNGLLDVGEECDVTDLGGQSCSSRGYDGGALACAGDCTFDEASCSVCGNGTIEGGEECDGAALGGASCTDQACADGSPGCAPDCTLDYGSCSECPVCDNDGTCETGEDCTTCPGDCVAGAGAQCGNGTCEAADGEDCVNCPADCAGKQNGWPGSRYCCGAGGGYNPVPCSDARCDGGTTWACTDLPAAPSCCGDLSCDGVESSFNCEFDCGAAPFCGDGGCDGGEDSCSCGLDCGLPPTTETHCGDGTDDDCDGFADCSDADCAGFPACSCLPLGATCRQDANCCSDKCRGPLGNRTCR